MEAWPEPVRSAVSVVVVPCPGLVILVDRVGDSDSLRRWACRLVALDLLALVLLTAVPGGRTRVVFVTI